MDTKEQFDRIVSIVTGYLRSSPDIDARDVAVEIFLSEGLNPSRRIIFFRTIDFIRQERRHRHGQLPPGAIATEKNGHRMPNLDELFSGLSRIDCRILFLHFGLEYSLREIAAQLSLPLSYVREAVPRALRKLREKK